MADLQIVSLASPGASLISWEALGITIDVFATGSGTITSSYSAAASGYSGSSYQIIKPGTIDQGTVYRDFNAGAWTGFNPSGFVWSAFVVDPAFTPQNIAAFEQSGFESDAFQSFFNSSVQTLFPPLIEQSAVYGPEARNIITVIDVAINQSDVYNDIVVITPDQFFAANTASDQSSLYEPAVFNKIQFFAANTASDQSIVYASGLLVTTPDQFFGSMPVSDPNYSNVVLQMHMDGVDNGTTFIDETGKVVSRTNTVTKTSTKLAVGTASAYFNGGSVLSVPSSTDLNLETGDFTIECWINPINGGHGGNYARVVQFGNNSTNGGLWIVIPPGNPGTILVQGYASGYFNLIPYTGSPTLENSQWHHIALTKTSNVYRLFINGVIAGEAVNSYNHVQNPVYIGANSGNGENFYGYIDDLRITKGVSRYDTAANFYPTALPNPTIPANVYAPVAFNRTQTLEVVFIDIPAGQVSPPVAYNLTQYITVASIADQVPPYDHIVFNKHQYITPVYTGPPTWVEYPVVYNLTQIITADTAGLPAIGVFLPQNVYNKDIVVQGDAAFTQSVVYDIASIFQPRQIIDVDSFDSSTVYPPADVFDPLQTEIADSVINQSAVYTPLASNWVYYASVDLISGAVVYEPQAFALTQFLQVDTLTQSTVYNPSAVNLNRTFIGNTAINQSALYGPTAFNSKQVFNGNTAINQSALYGPQVFTLTQRLIVDLISAPIAPAGPAVFNSIQIVTADQATDASAVYSPVVTHLHRTFAGTAASNQSTVYTPVALVLNTSYNGDTAFTQSTVYGPSLTLKTQIVQSNTAATQSTVYTPTAANADIDIHPVLVDQSIVFGPTNVEAVNRIFAAEHIAAPAEGVLAPFDVSNYTRTVDPIFITAGEIVPPSIFNSTRYFEAQSVWESFEGEVFQPSVLILNRTFSGSDVIIAGAVYNPESVLNLNREFSATLIDQSTVHNPFGGTLVQTVDPVLFDQSNVRTPVITPAPQAVMSADAYAGEGLANLYLTTIANQKLFPRGEVGEEMLADVTTYIQEGMIASAYEGSYASAIMTDEFIGLSISRAYEGVYASAGVMATEGLIKAYGGDEMLVSGLVTDSIFVVDIPLSEVMNVGLDIHASFGLPTASAYEGANVGTSIDIIYAGQQLHPLLMKVGSSFEAAFDRPFTLDLAEDCRCGVPKVYVHTNIDINIEGGDSLFDKYYGDAIYMHAELQCNRRLSAQIWTGEHFEAVDESEFVLAVNHVDGGGTAIASLDGGSSGTQYHKLCKGNFIPSGNNLPIEIIDVLGDDCVDYQFITGEWFHVGTGGFSTSAQLVATIKIEDMLLSWANLTTDPPFRATIYADVDHYCYLTTDRDMRMGPAIAYEGVNWRGGAFHEELIHGYTGESATATLVIEYEVEFIDGGSLLNEYQYQFPNGDVDTEKTSVIAIETYYFRHDLKARCF